VDIVGILRRGDPREIREALAEVHRQKSFALADSEYFKEELKNAARYHAYHIALMSVILPEVEVDEDSVTGLDYRLAKAFREATQRCGGLSVAVKDEFFKMVVEELNALLRSLCAQPSVNSV